MKKLSVQSLSEEILNIENQLLDIYQLITNSNNDDIIDLETLKQKRISLLTGWWRIGLHRILFDGPEVDMRFIDITIIDNENGVTFIDVTDEKKPIQGTFTLSEEIENWWIPVPLPSEQKSDLPISQIIQGPGDIITEIRWLKTQITNRKFQFFTRDNNRIQIEQNLLNKRLSLLFHFRIGLQKIVFTDREIPDKYIKISNINTNTGITYEEYVDGIFSTSGSIPLNGIERVMGITYITDSELPPPPPPPEEDPVHE